MNAEDTDFIALSLSPDPNVRGRVASYPRCPGEVLLSLLNDDDERVSDLALLNPSLPPEARTTAWEHIVQQGDFESVEGAQLWRVMFNPNAPVDLMERILSHDFDDLQPAESQNLKLRLFVCNLLESPYCPAHAVRRAIIDGPPDMRNWAAGNPSLSPDLVEILIDNGDGVFELASNPAASHRISAIVPRLTTRELLDVPRNIKDNESEAVVLCTQALSEWLAQNPEPDHDGPYTDYEVFPSVVVRVLTTYSSSPDEISRLCCHENPFVRQLAGRNPTATPEDRVMVALLAST